MNLIERIRKLNIAQIAFLLLVIYFFKGAIISFYDNTRLGRYGVSGRAVISPEKYAGARRHGPGKYYYTFQVDGIVYKGNAEKEEGVTVGDTIDIFYLPEEPEVNCSYEYADGIFFQQLVED